MKKPSPPRYLLRTFAVILSALTAACVATGASAVGDRLRRIEKSPQYNDGRFANALPMTEADWGLSDVLAMAGEWLSNKQKRRPDGPIPVEHLTTKDFGAPSSDLAVRWLGHSTVFVEIEGKRILTDPVWSKNASPIQGAGPKRFFPPPISLEDLPSPDAVLISHDHYDHLDKQTIVALKDRTRFYVPLGVGAHLESWGVNPSRIQEFDWWESVRLDGLTLVCTPSRHFSGRGLGDRNRTLWSSWSIIGERRRVYFGGDSGLFHELSEIGERFGPFDVTMLDTGAYNKRWPDVHMGPEQAVLAHRALRGKVLIPIHWGLFELAMHTWTEPAERLRAIAAKDGDVVAQPRPGELFTMDGPIPSARWWPREKWQTADQAPVRSSHLDPNWVARYARPSPTVADREP